MGALTGMKKGLKDTAEGGFAAKAALVGAMYALERLFAVSGKAGTDLTNFNATIGTSAQALQQYQYAARQVGVSNQEVEGTFRALQGTMTKTLMGEGAPKGLARVSQLTGGMTAQDIDRFAKQPALLLQKLQQYAAKETNAGLRNEVLKSFGVGEGMVAALTRQAFKPEVLARAPTYGDKEIGALDRSNAAWSNLGNQIEMAFGHMNAAHGGKLAGEISGIVTEVEKLATAFIKLAEKAHLSEGVKLAFQGWTEIIGGATKATTTVGDALGDPKKMKELKKDIADFFTDTTPGETNLVSVFHGIAGAVRELSGAFGELGSKVEIFEWIGDIFEGWALIFNGVTKTVTALSEATDDPKKMEALKGNVASFFTSELPSMAKMVVSDWFSSDDDKAKKEKSAEGYTPKRSTTRRRREPRGAPRDPVPVTPVTPAGAPPPAEGYTPKLPPPAPAAAVGPEAPTATVPPGPAVTNAPPAPPAVVGPAAPAATVAPIAPPALVAPLAPAAPAPAKAAPTAPAPAKAAPTAPAAAAEPKTSASLSRSQPQPYARAAPQLRLVVPNAPTIPPAAVAPPMPAMASNTTSNTNMTINQSLHFQHDGKDAQRTADASKKAIKDAWMTNSARTGGV